VPLWPLHLPLLVALLWPLHLQLLVVPQVELPAGPLAEPPLLPPHPLPLVAPPAGLLAEPQLELPVVPLVPLVPPPLLGY